MKVRLSALIMIIVALRIVHYFATHVQVVPIEASAKQFSYDSFCLKSLKKGTVYASEFIASVRKKHSPLVSYNCKPVVALTPSLAYGSWQFADSFRDLIEHRLATSRPRIARLCSALLLGSIKYDADYSSFKHLGLLHLFSVSGLHINFAYTLFVHLLNGLLQLVGLLLYRSWFWRGRARLPALGILVLPILAGYVTATGARPPAVRAFLLCLTAQCSSRGLRYLLWAFATQVIVFPESLWTTSFGISWTVYIIIKSHHHESTLQWGRILQMQVLIFLGVSIWLPQQPLSSIFFNLLFLPFAGLVFFAAVAHLFFLDPWSGVILQNTADLSQFFSDFGNRYNLFINLGDILPLRWNNLICKVLFLGIGLICSQKLTKTYTNTK